MRKSFIVLQYRHLGAGSWPGPDQLLRFNVTCDDAEYWVRLYKGKTLVGQCALYFTMNSGCLMRAFIIYKKFRRQGFGSILLQEAVKDIPLVTLWVLPKNVAAQNLYCKHGFYFDGTDRNGQIMRKSV